MTIEVFSDRELKQPIVGHRLVENVTYYIDWGSLGDAEIIDNIFDARLEKFISWMPGNRFATLKITNYVGLMNVAGEVYDVRSGKFLQHLSGAEQFESLSREIEAISRRITIDPVSPSLTNVSIDWSSPSSSILHEFNYHYQSEFGSRLDERPSVLIELIKQNPSFSYESSVKQSFLWEVKKSDHRLLRSLAVSFGERPEQGYKRSSAKQLSRKLSETHQFVTYDTPENRFVKAYFQRVEQVCNSVLGNYPKNEGLKHRASKLLHIAQQALASDFLVELGNLMCVPMQSTILEYRHGYKEIRDHYFKARMSVLPIFNNFLENRTTSLKDISDVYEAWCFYKVASFVLEGEMSLKGWAEVIEDDMFFYEATLANDKFEVSYNKEYKRSDRTSYSSNLRPDISVKNLSNGEVTLFDAKYRVHNLLDGNGNGNIKVAKHQPSDLHKMHTYLDAIAPGKAAVALYVGELFRFFCSRNFDHIFSSPHEEFEPEGVGVIPLVPQLREQELEDFIDKKIRVA